MLIINRVILHILDFNQGLNILSNKELDYSNPVVTGYIDKHIKHIKEDPAKRVGEFTDDSEALEYIKKYKNKEISFIEVSSYFAKRIYEEIYQSDDLNPMDLMAIDFSYEDIRYFAILSLASKKAYTHQVINDEEGVYNDFIRHHAILPGEGQKIDSYALIEMENLYLEYSDKKRRVNGEEVFIFPEKILSCNGAISGKETVKKANKLVREISEKYGQNSVITISKAKNYIYENGESSSVFSPFEFADRVFENSDQMKNELKSELKELDLPDKVKVEKKFAQRTGKNHKIKTDTGIEISFPSEYFQNQDYIEFINKADGTISIELKNIGKITNK